MQILWSLRFVRWVLAKHLFFGSVHFQAHFEPNLGDPSQSPCIISARELAVHEWETGTGRHKLKKNSMNLRSVFKFSDEQLTNEISGLWNFFFPF